MNFQDERHGQTSLAERSGDVSLRLLNVHPPPTATRTTGLDTMVVLVRRMFAVTLHHDKLDQEITGQTAVTEYAWQRFPQLHELTGPSFDEARAKADEDKLRVLNTVGLGADAPFKDFIHKVPHWERVGGEFTLWRPVLWLVDDVWVEKPAEGQEFRNTPNRWVVPYNANTTDETLAKHVGSRFGIFYNKAGPWHELWASAEPPFVRVAYQPNAEAPSSFEELWTFNMPAPGLLDSEEETTIEVKHHDVQYTLAAIVRLATSVSSDAIRTYSTDGMCFDAPTLSRDSWSVADKHPKGQQWYMLLYQQVEPSAMNPSGGEFPAPPLPQRSAAFRRAAQKALDEGAITNAELEEARRRSER